MNEKEKEKTTIAKTIVLSLILIIACIIIWFLTSKKETYISTTNEDNSYNALECTSSHPSDPFFVSETAQAFTHSLKVLFVNNLLNEISYRYDGRYDTEMRAENAEAWLHADYNKYLSANSVNQESLNPVFSTDKSKLIISLYAERNKINDVVARLFFIDSDGNTDVNKFSPTDYKKLYESKGFSCKFNN